MNIYADNAATTKMSKTAIDKMLPYMDNIFANPSSLHTPAQLAMEAITEARADVAKVLGCETDEIIFTSGGSESDNQAIISAARIGEAKGKKHIISTEIEHHAVLHTLKRLEKEGFLITLLKTDANGLVSAEDVKNAITDKTCLVTIMYANNEIGTIEPISEIGKVCKDMGVLFHTDAVQAAGHLHINVKEQNIDMLSLSAHKFNGPKGVGALYVRRGVRLTNIIDGGAQEKGKRAGTHNVPAIMGMAAALVEAEGNIDKFTASIMKKRDRLIEGLLEIPHSVLNGDRDKRLPSNVNICFEGIEGESLLLMLDMEGIYASSGSACTSGSLDPSHVLLAIGRPHEIAHGSLRLSIDHETTDEEVEYMIEKTKEVVEHLRKMSPVWSDLQKGKREYVIQ